MPRYYFNLYRDGTPVLDDEGLDLQDDTVAKREAMESLRDIIADSLAGDLKPVQVRVEIVKEGAVVVDRLTAQIAVPSKTPK